MQYIPISVAMLGDFHGSFTVSENIAVSEWHLKEWKQGLLMVFITITETWTCNGLCKSLPFGNK